MVDRDREEVNQEDPGILEPEPKGGMGFLTKILMVMGVLIFQVVVAYFGLQYLIFRDTGKSEKPKAEQQIVKEVGPVVEFDELVVNPAGSLGRRFVVVKMALELTNADVQKQIDQQKPLINDGLIQVLSSKSVEYLSNVAMRDSLREEMRLTINERLPGGKGISNVFFTGFVLQ